jgi:hypothetical protein
VIEKTIQPLVNPLALLSPSEAEIVLLKAIVAMNPGVFYLLSFLTFN